MAMLERLISASIQGAVGLGGVWLLCFLFRKIPATIKVWLWRLAMLKMAISLVIVPTIHVLPAEPVKAATSQVAVRAPTYEVPVADLTPAELTLLLNSMPASPAPTVSAATALPKPQPSTPVAIWIWIVGITAFSVLAAFSVSRLSRSLRASKQVDDPEVQESAREVAGMAGLRREPRLRTFESNGSPFVTGLVRPLVAVPEALLLNLRELRMALLHEFAHLRRGDLRWSFAMGSLRTLFWFHPLAWLAEREHRVQSEMACDAFVLNSGGSLRDYAMTLLRIAAIEARGPQSAAALSAVGSRRTLLRRLTEMNEQSRPRRSKLRVVLAIALPAAALLTPIHLAARAPQQSEGLPVLPSNVPQDLDDILIPVLDGAQATPPAAPSQPAAPAAAITVQGHPATPTTPMSQEHRRALEKTLAKLQNIKTDKFKSLTPAQRAEIEKSLKEAMEEIKQALSKELPQAMEEARRAMKTVDGVSFTTQDRHVSQAQKRAIDEQIEANVQLNGVQKRDLDIRLQKQVDEEAQTIKALVEGKSLPLHLQGDEKTRAEAEMRKAQAELDAARAQSRVLIERSQDQELKKIRVKIDGQNDAFVTGRAEFIRKMVDERAQEGKIRITSRVGDEGRGNVVNIDGSVVYITMTGGDKDDKKGEISYRIVGEPKAATGMKVAQGGVTYKTQTLSSPSQYKVLKLDGQALSSPAFKAMKLDGRLGTTFTEMKALNLAEVKGLTNLYLRGDKAGAINLIYSGKKLTKEQQKRLAEIDAQIRKLNQERQKLGGSRVQYYTAPGQKVKVGNSPSEDPSVQKSYPGIFGPSGPSSDPAKGGGE